MKSLPQQPIDYAAPATRAGVVSATVSYERIGSELTITVSPLPAWKVLFGAGIVLFLMTPLSLVSAAIAWAVIRSPRSEPENPVILLLSALIWTGWIIALLRTVRRARLVRTASIIRVSPERLEIATPGKGGLARQAWARNELADVRVRSAGAFPAVHRRARLQVVDVAERETVLFIDWPSSAPMARIEDNVRDVLGLAPIR